MRGEQPLRAAPVLAGDRHRPALDLPPVPCLAVGAEWEKQTGLNIEVYIQ